MIDLYNCISNEAKNFQYYKNNKTIFIDYFELSSVPIDVENLSVERKIVCDKCKLVIWSKYHHMNVMFVRFTGRSNCI